MKKLLIAMALLTPLSVSADTDTNALEVYNAEVSAVRAYELDDNRAMGVIYLNQQMHVGPNPSNPDVQCELWTYNKNVLNLAMDARQSKTPVTVHYVDSSNVTSGPKGPGFCQVKFINHSW